MSRLKSALNVRVELVHYYTTASACGVAEDRANAILDEEIEASKAGVSYTMESAIERARRRLTSEGI